MIFETFATKPRHPCDTLATPLRHPKGRQWNTFMPHFGHRIDLIFLRIYADNFSSFHRQT